MADEETPKEEEIPEPVVPVNRGSWAEMVVGVADLKRAGFEIPSDVKLAEFFYQVEDNTLIFLLDHAAFGVVDEDAIPRITATE